jgi:TonB family protein
VEKERIKGWIGTTALHIVLCVILFLMHVSLDRELPEFVEVSWGAVAQREPARPAQTRQISRAEREPVVAQRTETAASQRPVILPERRLPAQQEEIIRLPEADKVDVASRISDDTRPVPDPTREQRDRDAGSILGERERFVLPGPDDARGDSPVAAGTSPDARVSDRDISYALEWVGDLTRRKVGGDLPEYPAGLNVEAVIRLRATVFPDGTIKSVRPVQRGNPRMEDAALNSVRYWRFEALARNQPQVEQDCFITFHFTLQ